MKEGRRGVSGGKRARGAFKIVFIRPQTAMQSSGFSYVPLPVAYFLHPTLPLAISTSRCRVLHHCVRTFPHIPPPHLVLTRVSRRCIRVTVTVRSSVSCCDAHGELARSPGLAAGGSGALDSCSVSAYVLSRDGTRLASGSGDKTVKVWDAATGDLV